jgi:tRNA dimethylallyltransferase
MARLALILMGPTASGKTDVALDLAARFPVEIVSVDSAQVFRGMDVGTAKPDRATLARFPHQLIDIVDPTERYSAGRFRADALACMDAIAARGNVPLLVGGTMLYFHALVAGMDDLPQAEPRVRAAIDERAAREGWPALHAELAAIDPQTAARLAPTDAQRIQRALEVFRVTGVPLSRHLGRRAPAAGWQFRAIALTPSDRAVLHERIASRFERMLAAGLVDELRGLRARLRLSPDLPSMRCVGYRQAWAHLEGECDERELCDLGIQATRQLAKRQITWLRQFDAARIDCLAPDAGGRAASELERALATEEGSASARAPQS